MVCMFAEMQEGPKCVAAYLTKERVTEYFKVLLVGPEGQTDLLKEKAIMKLPSLHRCGHKTNLQFSRSSAWLGSAYAELHLGSSKSRLP